jgi:hypothetical protein
MRPFVRTLVFLLGYCLIAYGHPARDGNLAGAVTDPSGGAISNAHGIIRWDAVSSNAKPKSSAGVNHDVNFRTDQRGGYSVNLPPGVYDVFISSDGFQPACQKVLVSAGKQVRFDRVLKLYATQTVTVPLD